MSNEAPERVWLYTVRGSAWTLSHRAAPGNIEYLRADLANRELSEGDVERVARALYACESARSDHASRVLSEATGRPVPGMAMEPWDECKDTFLSDALAALTAYRSQP